MNVSMRHWVPLDAGNITSHVYDVGEAYLELGTRTSAEQSVLIWVGKEGADLGEEAAALRKLAQVASDLAGHLDRRSVVAETRGDAHDALARQLRQDAGQTVTAAPGGLRWERSPDQSTWVAEHRNMRLAVTRTTAGEWKACVTSDPGSGEPFDQFSPAYSPTRLAAQRWAERTAGVTR